MQQRFLLQIYCLFYFLNNTTVLIMYFDFYSMLLHVSAVHFIHLQVRILVHTKNEKVEASLYKQWI
jgi:hypothetical protein